MTEQPRRSGPPLLDALGKLCTEGKQAADYLWQVPKDEVMRQKILELLDQIALESAKQGKEMPRICEELKMAAKADRKSTRLNSSHLVISYAVFCLKKKKPPTDQQL